MSRSVLIKVVELGPFGCRIDRGEVKDISRIPKDLRVSGIEESDVTTVYVEPVLRDKISSFYTLLTLGDGQP
jgi:hypothetical protein